MIGQRWFSVFTCRRGKWVPVSIPIDEHLWDFLVAMQSRDIYVRLS
jgi:hypothetical protein